MKPSNLSVLVAVLVAGTVTPAYATSPKKRHPKHHTSASSLIIQKTVINNYGLINNGLVQKTQQASTAISNTQDNSLHQDSSTHQTLNQTQSNTLNQTQVNTQINSLNQSQVNRSSSTTATSASSSNQAFTALSWSTADGKQYMEVSGSDLHLKPRFEGTGPHTVTAISTLNLPDAKKWQVSFDIRFGVLTDQASSFHLMRDGHDIGLISADGFTKGVGVFIGKDNQVWGAVANNEWHHVSFMDDGNYLTVGLDGKQVGSGGTQGVPQSFSLLNNQDMTVACRQEGVWVRNIQAQTGD